MAPSLSSQDPIETLQTLSEGVLNSASATGSAWSSSLAAAYDFRSDYVTVPTMPMLKSILSTTLRDDVMMEDPTTNQFQEFMANLTGKEDALFMLSGTMGNQVALRTALKTPPYSILTDERSHALRMEAGGAATLCGALVLGVRPANGHHLTLDDVKRHATVTSSVYSCPTRVISLENTLAGTILPLVDVQQISAWAHSQHEAIHMHLDGARLWEADAAEAGSLQQYCKEFDSVTLCFTKGLGAPIGAILVGSRSFVERARMVRKLFGGGIRAAGLLTAPAKVAVEDVFLGGRLHKAQGLAKSLAAAWTLLGGRLVHPTETNMVWLDLEDTAVDKTKFFALAKNSGLKVMEGMLEGRIVVHYQIGKDAVFRLCAVMRQVLPVATGVDV